MKTLSPPEAGACWPAMKRRADRCQEHAGIRNTSAIRRTRCMSRSRAAGVGDGPRLRRQGQRRAGPTPVKQCRAQRSAAAAVIVPQRPTLGAGRGVIA